MNNHILASKWSLFVSNNIPRDYPKDMTSLTSELTLDDGGVVKSVDVEFSNHRLDICKVIGRNLPVESQVLLVGSIECDEDCEVILGAGADWWWTAWVNGKMVFDRSMETNGRNGNFYATYTWVDWLFPISLHKGTNLLAFIIEAGQQCVIGLDFFDKDRFPGFYSPMTITPETLSGYLLKGNTTRDPVSYRVGEDIEFIFELRDSRALRDEGLYLKLFALGDDGNLKTDIVPISERNPVSFVTSLSRPGFVHVTATLCNIAGETAGHDLTLLNKGWRFEGGAGADIDKIRPAAEEPEDFVEYWTKQKEELAKIPVRADVEPYIGSVFPNGTEILPEVDIFLVRVDCLGPRPVTGFLSVPKAEGKYPARVVFCGYGGLVPPTMAHTAQSSDTISLLINAHGYELHRGLKYYEDFRDSVTTKNPNYAFSEEENSDPNTAYFRGMVLRVLRAIDFIKTLPKWNGKSITACGGSQGGLQAIWAAGLHPDITRCESSITWCCNFAGHKLDNRIPSWGPKYVPGLNYFDPVFHAAHIPEKCFVDIPRAGLGDYICPPSGVTAMYNQIKCPKCIAYFQNSTHPFVPSEATISRRR